MFLLKRAKADVYFSNVTCEMESEVQIFNGLRQSTTTFIPETTENPEFNLKYYKKKKLIFLDKTQLLKYNF